MNNLSKKGLAVKAQAAIDKEMDALTRAGVCKPPRMVVNLGVSMKAVAVKFIKKACLTSGKEGSVLANVLATFQSHVLKVLPEQLCDIPFILWGGIPLRRTRREIDHEWWLQCR